MKRISTTTAIFTGVSIMAILLVFTSCSKKTFFPSSTVVPAARGYVKIKKDNNANYSIEVSLSNLAEVERLQAGKNTYVVWMLLNEGGPKNIGKIDSDKKMFSKKLRASFHTVSATKPERIFITAEEDGSVQYPGSLMVLSVDIR